MGNKAGSFARNSKICTRIISPIVQWTCNNGTCLLGVYFITFVYDIDCYFLELSVQNKFLAKSK